MNRDLRYDIARDISILWIVLVFHLSAYLGAGYNLNNNFSCNNITWASLGCFSFISGLFIGKRDLVSRRDIFEFYKKRLLRIYPLFLLSAVCLYLIDFNGLVETLYGLLGISAFTGHQPLTLWFISMILLFYLISPLLLRKTLIARILSSVMVFFVLGILFKLHCCDIRVLFNFFCYVMGVIVLKTNMQRNKIGENLLDNIYFSVTTILVYCLFLMFASGSFVSPAVKAIVACLGVVAILSLASILNTLMYRRNSILFSNIAYSSMALYLFHRLFYFFGLSLFTPGSTLGKVLYLVFIVFPVGYILCFYIQKMYDKIVKNI